MRSIIEELWYGNICPNSDSTQERKETSELMKYIADHYQSLISEATDKQKAILEKFADCQSELTSINERDIFVYAFKLGARIALEIMNTDNILKY